MIEEVKVELMYGFTTTSRSLYLQGELTLFSFHYEVL